MRSSSVCVLIVLLLFGSGAASFWYIQHRSRSVTDKIEDIILRQGSGINGIEFEDIQCVRGETEDGFLFTSHLYKSSDGIVVSIITEECSTPISANRQLQTNLQKAIKVIERKPKVNEKGQQVGERAIAMFDPIGQFQESASVFWTDGSLFHHIESCSLQHALEFEKRFYR